MKIVLLNVLHEAYDKRVFQKIAKSLVGAGHEVMSICPGDDTLPEESQGVRFRYIPAAPSKRRRLLSVLRLAKLGRAEKGDVYFAPEPESWVAALLIKLTTGGKVVFDMHEHVPTEFAKFFPTFLQGFLAWFTVKFMRLFAHFTDHIILTRKSFQEPWSDHPVPRTVVINSNHVQPRCTTIPEALEEQFAGRPTLIHQGQFSEVRGSYQLLDAMKILVKEKPDLRCIILGEYVLGSETLYKKTIRDAGLEENFVFPGTVPYDEVPQYIAVAQIGLILFQPGPVNHTLAMPHKLFDYMREAKPVIAPDFALEVHQIVAETDCGYLLDVTNAKTIADAITALLDNPEEAARFGENGRRAVEETYNWAREEEKLLKAFEKLRPC